MASAHLSKPGTEYGPCAEPCEHRDCAESRQMAESICRVCKEPIGYERRFCQDMGPKTYIHTVCLMEEIEKEQKAARR